MQLLGVPDTTTLSYWLNWRVLLCAIWVLLPMFISLFVIRKYEYLDDSESDREGAQQERARFLYGDEAWRPCVKEIHPIYLMVFRIIAFGLLLWAIVADVVIHGGDLFFYYTQWTFTLVTIYFAFGSVLSIYGCLQHYKTCSTVNGHNVRIDAEKGFYVPLTSGETGNAVGMVKDVVHQGKSYVLQNAALWCYAFKIIFQMTAGSVMLTDSVYWFVIFPFLTIKEYKMSFLTVTAHSLNLVLLLGDTALNSLRFPWFRITYFILLTGFYVIFEWTVHIVASTWWPYPFLDLSAPYAPLWYLVVAVLHLPCYGIFALLVKTKYYMLSTWFSQSYQCLS
ncbi:hypothetical protein LguiA_017057 [Lonicera macranthoides]